MDTIEKTMTGEFRNSISKVDIAVLAGQEGPLLRLNLFRGPVHFYQQHFGGGLACIFHAMRVSRYNHGHACF